MAKTMAKALEYGRNSGKTCQQFWQTIMEDLLELMAELSTVMASYRSAGHGASRPRRTCGSRSHAAARHSSQQAAYTGYRNGEYGRKLWQPRCRSRTAAQAG